MSRVERFGPQAGSFDRRAGLAPEVGRAVARALLELCEARPGDLVLELGCGTGTIGEHLAAGRVGYLGIDLSRPMLTVFGRKLADRAVVPRLVQADADAAWPVRPAAITAVFASRVVHLLDVERVAIECQRVCRPGGWLIVGRVVRDALSLRSRLRQERLHQLAELGVTPRSGGEAAQRLIAACTGRGAVPLPPRVVASWRGSTTAEQVLRGWEQQPAMAGATIAADMRAAVIASVRSWARRELGDLQRAEPFTERYRLEGVRFAVSRAVWGAERG